MAERSLEGVASFVRDLGSACSAVRLVGDMLLAGSHDGLLLCLDAATGGERWRLQVDGPVSDIALDSDRVYATASASLHAVDAAGGELLWSRELEGASDYVQAGDGHVWATSSVYELEVADFVEATVWRFDAGGDEQERWVFAERPWHVGLHADGGILLGLGRPRCGYLRIETGQKTEHFELDNESPVTCGACDSAGRFLFGHADGTISSVGSAEASEKPRESLVTALAPSDSGWVSGHDDGTIATSDSTVTAPGSIDAVASLGPNAWASSWNGSTPTLTILQFGTISIDARVRQMHSSESSLALGDDLGRVFLIESEVVGRRLSDNEETSPEDFRNSELRARLRMLRNR